MVRRKLMSRTALRQISLVVAGLALVGCTEDPTGQIVVAVQTDVHLPKDIDTVRIEVFNEGEPKFKNDYERLGTEEAPFLLPGTLTVVASDDPADVVRVVVSGRSGGSDGELRIVREVVTTVPDARTATLQLPLQYLCDGQAEIVNGEAQDDCPEGQTCLAGTCEDESIDSETLPDYTEEDIFVPGVCLDVAVCFNTGDVATIDPEDCTIDPLDGNTNVALQTEGDGICGGLGCFVALDGESTLGWQTRDDGRVQLPPAVCTQIDSGKVVNVVTATATELCPFKTVSVPTCGPWSAAGPGAGNLGPVALAGGQSQPVSVRVGQSAIYWASAGTFSGEGAIKSVSAIGGTPVLEASNSLPLRDLAIGDDNTLYWTRADESMPLAGAIVRKGTDGTIEDLVANEPLPEGIAQFGDFVYYTNFSPTGGVYRAPTTGAADGLLIASGNYPVRIVADETHVYFTNEGSAGLSDGSVARHAQDGSGATEVIADSVDTPRGLTLDRTSGSTTAMYWTEFQEGGSVMRVAVDNGVLGEITEVASGQSFPNGVTVNDDGFVYWSNRGDGSVMRVSTSGGSAEMMASGQRSPGAIVVDDTSIYWLNEGSAGQENGALMRIPKPF